MGVSFLAAAFRVSESTVRRWIRSGKLRATDISSDLAYGLRPTYRVSESDLAEFLEKHPRLAKRLD